MSLRCLVQGMTSSTILRRGAAGPRVTTMRVGSALGGGGNSVRYGAVVTNCIPNITTTDYCLSRGYHCGRGNVLGGKQHDLGGGHDLGRSYQKDNRCGVNNGLVLLGDAGVGGRERGMSGGFLTRYLSSTTTTADPKKDDDKNDNVVATTTTTLDPSRNPASRRVPTIAEARTLTISYTEMHNEVLLAVSASGNKDAIAEVLRRHIMVVDDVPYEKAEAIFDGIAKSNRKGFLTYTIPNKMGMVFAMSMGLISFPLVFDLDTARVFNEVMVTTDVPEPEDLETVLEVGAWTWNWMEPPLGQLSFFLLCLQFARAQMQNIGLRPFSDKVKQVRADRLIESYPNYDSKLLESFSKADNYYN